MRETLLCVIFLFYTITIFNWSREPWQLMAA